MALRRDYDRCIDEIEDNLRTLQMMRERRFPVAVRADPQRSSTGGGNVDSACPAPERPGLPGIFVPVSSTSAQETDR